MIEKTIFPREEKAEVLFDKILSDKWAYNKLFQTFCDNLFCNDDSGTDLSPLQFTEALFNCYTNKDLSAFLMAISQNTLFDLLRNSFLIPYRFNDFLRILCKVINQVFPDLITILVKLNTLYHRRIH